MNYITDTHALVWYFTENELLSERAQEVFHRTIEKGSIIIPTIVLAEILYISKRARISLTFEETLEKIKGYENFDISPLDIDILKVANKIETDMEMHDRLIVATAMYHDATLITKDEKIRGLEIVTTVW